MQKLNGSTLELTYVNRIGFFQRLNNEEENHQCQIPNSVETQTFWRGIWSERKEHHKNAKWLKDVKKELKQDEGQDKIDITKDKMTRVIRNMPNWKALGPDNVQRFLVKEFNSIAWQISGVFAELSTAWDGS